MIAGLSKAVTTYLAPVLLLTSVILSLLVFLSPTIALAGQVSLLSVTPSTALTQNGTQSSNVDGPSVFMGALGSCSRPNDATTLNCTAASLSPIFNLAALPKGSPEILSSPTTATPAFVAISLGFSVVFFFLFTFIAFQDKLGDRLGSVFGRPNVHRASAWLGLIAFMIGITSYLVLRMWFGKAVEDFNESIVDDTEVPPSLIATIGNGFTMIWVAYAFHAVPLMCAMSRLHASGPGGGKFDV